MLWQKDVKNNFLVWLLDDNRALHEAIQQKYVSTYPFRENENFCCFLLFNSNGFSFLKTMTAAANLVSCVKESVFRQHTKKNE
jgi:hypothetical protein